MVSIGPPVDELPLPCRDRLSAPSRPIPLYTCNSPDILTPSTFTTTTIMANKHDQASTNYKEAFSLFDRRGTGRVSGDLLGDLLRACGQNPTLAEIADLEKSVGPECM